MQSLFWDMDIKHVTLQLIVYNNQYWLLTTYPIQILFDILMKQFHLCLKVVHCLIQTVVACRPSYNQNSKLSKV